ncbi:MAG: FkbM family methyltransferase [Deltaproteobacteria bacterium]|nr:FkbM family methyltransferase [Deltaproteobacteria bacterium]
MGFARSDPLIFRIRNNIVMEVPIRLLHVFKEIFMEECYTRRLAFRLPDRPTIIDIGANAGFFSLFAASRFSGATIIAFEPIAVNFKQLQRNRNLNKNACIFCRQMAVYGHSGEVLLTFDPDDSFTTAASVIGKENRQKGTVKVASVTLADIFDEYQLERCDFLKMDCEGSEYDILYNCPDKYLHRVIQMALEVHQGTETNHNIESLAHYLNSHDFRTYRSGHMLYVSRKKGNPER